MSTISGSGNGNSNESDNKIRKQREEHRQSESEMVKKHQRELRKLTEMHSAEIEKLKQSHNNQLSDLKNETNETISVRDHKYQKDMDNLRALHRKQLESTAGTSQRQLELGRDVANKDIAATKARNDERLKGVFADYERATREREAKNSEALEKVRADQQKEVSDYRESMNRRHKMELELVNQQHQKELGESETNARNYRKASESRFRDQNVRSFQDRQQATDDLEDMLIRERRGQAQNEKILRDGFKDALQDTRERYEKKMSKDRDMLDKSANETRESVYERINNQLRGLEADNAELKDVAARDRVMTKYNADREIGNMRDAFSKNLEVAQRERDEAVRAGNDTNHKDIEKIQRANSKLLVESNRESTERFNSQEERHKFDVDTLEGDFQAQQQMTRSNADKRVRHIVDDTETQKARLSEYHDQNREEVAKSHRQEMAEVRIKVEREKHAAVDRLKEMMRKRDIEHEEKMSQIVAKYEKEIARMNDELVRVRRGNDEDMKRLTGELTRSHQTELDTQAVQYQEKLRKSQDLHKDELKSVNQKHQERVDQLITTMKAKA